MHLSIINSYATDLLASGSSLGATPGGYTAFNSSSYDTHYYTLSPNTRLEFTADSNLFVESTSSGDYEYALASNQFYAYDNQMDIIISMLIPNFIQTITIQKQ